MPPKKDDSDYYDTHSHAYYRKTCNIDPTCFLNMLVNQLLDALLLIGALVHLQYSEFLPVFLRISEAIKKDGIICLSLKEGEGKSCSSDGRMFTLWRHDHLEKIYRDHGFSVIDFFRNISAVNSHDVWLNYLLRKEGTD